MLKNNEKKRLRTIAICMGMSVISICGCQKKDSYKINIGNSKIIYEEGNINGNVSYEDIEELKIVTIKQGDTTFKKCMIVYKECYGGTRSFNVRYDIYNYIDIETGVTLLKLKDTGVEEYTILLGEELEIIEEQNFFDFFFDPQNIQREYDINELLTYFHEEIESQLNDENTLSKTR